MRHTEVDQPCLLAAGDDLDAVTQGELAGQPEGLAVAGAPQGVGAHRPHRAARHVAQALREATEAVQAARDRLLAEQAALVQARCQAHRLAQPVYDVEAATLDTRHHEVKAVRAEIDRRQRVRQRRGGTRLHAGGTHAPAFARARS